MDPSAAMRRVSAGQVLPSAWTHAACDDLWCRLVAQGEVLDRHHDSERDPAYRMHLVLVAHPDLRPGEVYALYALGWGAFSVYRTTAPDAMAALRHPGAFNL
jgi:hypothetical protein